MANKRYPTGWLIVLAGAVLLLGKLGFFAFVLYWLWPLLLLVLGLWLHYLCMNGTLPSRTLIAADTLVVYAMIFLFCNLLGWGLLKFVWPGFFLGLAFGIYTYYRFTRSRTREAFTAAIILAMLALVLFAVIVLTTSGFYNFIVLLMLIGFILFWIRKEIV